MVCMKKCINSPLVGTYNIFSLKFHEVSVLLNKKQDRICRFRVYPKLKTNYELRLRHSFKLVKVL